MCPKTIVLGCECHFRLRSIVGFRPWRFVVALSGGCDHLPNLVTPRLVSHVPKAMPTDKIVDFISYLICTNLAPLLVPTAQA